MPLQERGTQQELLNTHPIPAEIGLFLSDEPSIHELIHLLDAIRPSLLSGLIRNVVRYSRSGAKVDTEDSVCVFAGAHDMADIEPVLPKLVVCTCNMLPTELNAGESV